MSRGPRARGIVAAVALLTAGGLAAGCVGTRLSTGGRPFVLPSPAPTAAAPDTPARPVRLPAPSSPTVVPVRRLLDAGAYRGEGYELSPAPDVAAGATAGPFGQLTADVRVQRRLLVGDAGLAGTLTVYWVDGRHAGAAWRAAVADAVA